MKTRVILAEDHQLVRECLRAALEKEGDIEVVDEARNGREAVSLASQKQPRVVVMDVVMPDLNGIEATRQILSASPNIKVLALSMHSDRRFVAGMLSAGASGYVLKDCAFEELAEAIRTVAADRTYLSPGIAGVVVEDYVKQLSFEGEQHISVLTPREREVAQLLAEGNSTKAVAVALHVSPKTIETHRRQLMEKLDIHSIAELTKYAIRAGLTSLEH
ncbi:MAG: response regulator transcription factor [Candidatus Brocadiae bacterium]|nr:response regulator transcription factor [Candidatus Brocadiia bacterium]